MKKEALLFFLLLVITIFGCTIPVSEVAEETNDVEQTKESKKPVTEPVEEEGREMIENNHIPTDLVAETLSFSW